MDSLGLSVTAGNRGQFGVPEIIAVNEFMDYLKFQLLT
jgi:hypothetical protein